MKKYVLVILSLLYTSGAFAECAYLPQGMLTAWSQDRTLWERDVSYEPVLSGNYPELEVTAFRITRLDHHNFLYESGFRLGDEITEINGFHVSDSEKLNVFLKTLTEQPQILILRNERSPIKLLNTNVMDQAQCN